LLLELSPNLKKLAEVVLLLMLAVAAATAAAAAKGLCRPGSSPRDCTASIAAAEETVEGE
jgi:Na+(H+)/acetate symporter ActP